LALSRRLIEHVLWHLGTKRAYLIRPHKIQVALAVIMSKIGTERGLIQEALAFLHSELKINFPNMAMASSTVDKAMGENGGIDLTPANINLQVKNDTADAFQFHL